MKAAPNSSTYRTMERPAYAGELRVKTWRWILPPSGNDDPTWAKRCREYWELQQETYGLKFSNFTMLVDYEEGFITTAAVVMEVLLGRREQGYVAPKARGRLQ